MTPEQAGAAITSHISVMREDIARAKSWILRASGTNVSGMADEWLRCQQFAEIRTVNTDAADCPEILTGIARTYSSRLSFLRAIWELINAGLLVPAGGNEYWQPQLEYKTSSYA